MKAATKLLMQARKMEDLVSDAELDEAWGNANFGGISKREVIRLGTLKCLAGWHQGFTSQAICTELGLINKKYEVTAKGEGVSLAVLRIWEQFLMNLTAEQIETLRKGLRDWEKPENRYAALNLLDSLGASPVQAEPVAWEAALIKDGKKILRYLSKNKPTERDFSEAMLEIGNVEVTPLYAHPPSGRDAEDAAIWKAVEGFERIYEVSSDGRVRSLDRVDSDNNQRKGTELNPNPDANGYKRVSLWRDGKVTHKTVHRLVATAFCDKPDGCEEVNHIDGDKANNVAENLEWVSSSYNTLHAARVLKVMQNRPVKGTFVSDGTVVTFDSLAEAEEAGFTRSLIHKCIIGKRTHHKGYAWEYVDAAIDAAMSAEGCRG